ncbi:MAG TPA: hypothetical protein VKQ27_08230 [Acetobacteraceae bacterium]|nr:hypothetical protein [Acetobacteraceae bacterium]
MMNGAIISTNEISPRIRNQLDAGLGRPKSSVPFPIMINITTPVKRSKRGFGAAGIIPAINQP